MQQNEKLVIRDTESTELKRICEIEKAEAKHFIIPYSLARHQTEFAKPDVSYKSIWCNDRNIGFLILVLEADARSVEFRRLVMAEPGCGYGKKAVSMVDDICRRELGRVRVWLDVFEENKRARHIYERCGYYLFGRSEYNGRRLLLYEKML